MIRNLLAITAGCAFGIGVGFLIAGLGTLAAGAWIAVAAGLVIVIELVNAVRRDRDKRRRARAEVWFRRDCEQLGRDFNRVKGAVQDRLFDGVAPIVRDLVRDADDERGRL